MIADGSIVAAGAPDEVPSVENLRRHFNINVRITPDGEIGGPKHRFLLPASALTGATFLILTDILARMLQRPEEIRLGIITAVFGAPFFLYLLLRRQRSVGIG